MEFPKDYVFQIVLFLLGVLGGVAIPLLGKYWQKVIAAVISIVLLFGAVFWIGYKLGRGANNSNGIEIPMANWTVNGSSVGEASSTNMENTGQFELTSTQAANSYSSPVEQLIYTWPSPGTFSRLNMMPMRGIESTIKISPRGASDEHKLVFCYYSLVYNSYPYTSVEQFIPFNQPTTIVWDFIGNVEPTDSFFNISNVDKLAITNGANALINENNSLSFTYYFRKLRDLWQYGEMVSNNYDPNQITNLQMVCNVSATRDYVGGSAGDKFVFDGTFTFGDVIVYPFEQHQK